MKKIFLFLALLIVNNYANAIEKLIEVPQIEIDGVEEKKGMQQPSPKITEIKEKTKKTEDATKQQVRDPFKAVLTPKESRQVSNQQPLDLFINTEIKLPSTARKIKKITIEYQNLNGSISTLEQELQGDVDWHFPLVLSQEIKNPAQEVSTNQKFNLSELFIVNTSETSIKIRSAYKMLRSFTLASPTRLVLDFENPEKRTLEDSYETNIPIFTQFLLQSYLDFYRVIIILDGQYDYIVKESKDKNQRIYSVDFK